MTFNQKQTIDYIGTLSAELAQLAETADSAALGFILRMAAMEARRLAARSGPAVKAAA